MWRLVRLVELLKKDLLKKEPSAQRGRFKKFLNPAAGELRIPPPLSCQPRDGLHPLSTTRPSFILTHGGTARGNPGCSTTPTHDNQRLLSSSNIQLWVSSRGSHQDSSDSVGGQVLMFFVFHQMEASVRGHPTFFISLPALSCRLWWQQRGPEVVSS